MLLILAAGIPYGLYLVVIGLSPADSGAVPLMADLVVGTVLLLAIVGVQRLRRAERGAPIDRPGALLILAAGLSQAVAGVLLVFALHLPALAIVGALSALYPVGTVVLGIVVLRERVRPFQLAGMVLAIAGVALLAVARLTQVGARFAHRSARCANPAPRSRGEDGARDSRIRRRGARISRAQPGPGLRRAARRRRRRGRPPRRSRG